MVNLHILLKDLIMMIFSSLKFDQEDFAGIMQISPSSHGENYKYDACSYLDCKKW